MRKDELTAEGAEHAQIDRYGFLGVLAALGG